MTIWKRRQKLSCRRPNVKARCHPPAWDCRDSSESSALPSSPDNSRAAGWQSQPSGTQQWSQLGWTRGAPLRSAAGVSTPPSHHPYDYDYNPKPGYRYPPRERNNSPIEYHRERATHPETTEDKIGMNPLDNTYPGDKAHHASTIRIGTAHPGTPDTKNPKKGDTTPLTARTETGMKARMRRCMRT